MQYLGTELPGDIDSLVIGTDQQHPVKTPERAEGLQNITQHCNRKGMTPGRIQEPRQTPLGVTQIPHRNNRPHRLTRFPG